MHGACVPLRRDVLLAWSDLLTEHLCLSASCCRRTLQPLLLYHSQPSNLATRAAVLDTAAVIPTHQPVLSRSQGCTEPSKVDRSPLLRANGTDARGQTLNRQTLA